MRRYIHNIRCIAVMIIAVCTFSSCVYDELREEPAPGVPEDRTMLRVGFQLPVMRAATGNGGGYEQGNDGENYIDIRNGGYRIYFFDSENRYIARFIPTLVTGPDNGLSDGYGITGIVPEALEEYDSFKIVVLANWPSYLDNGIIPGVSTIDDLCSAEWAQYPCLTNFELDSDNGRTIPFYGVHEYRNVKFVKGKLTTLEEPVALLRAMAKVEVILDMANISFSNVSVCRYNQKGYCAPASVYSQSDYNHNGDWNADYVRNPHLVGGNNDSDNGTEPRKLDFQCENRRTTDKKETWIAYLPEYRNIDGKGKPSDDKAYIEVRLNDPSTGNKPFRIYFAQYENGKADETRHFNIERNNLYRFTVSFRVIDFLVTVDEFNPVYEEEVELE